MERPLVSVVIAARNAERYLREALESVKAQTYDRHETIVVDGHSTDDTAAIVRSFPGTRHVLQKGSGFAVAWNEGIDEAVGELVALLDSDDIWTKDKLALQVARLQEGPRVDCVLGHMRFFLGGDGPPPPSFRVELLDSAHPAHMPGALLARRTVFDTVGRFGGSWQIASDVDWFARLKDSRTPVAMLEDVVLHKRVHDSNLSYTARVPVYRREMLQVLKDSADRQRGRAK